MIIHVCKKIASNAILTLGIIIYFILPTVCSAEYPYKCDESGLILGKVTTYKVGWMALSNVMVNSCKIAIDKNGAHNEFYLLSANMDYVVSQKMCDLALYAFQSKSTVQVAYCLLEGTTANPSYRLKEIMLSDNW